MIKIKVTSGKMRPYTAPGKPIADEVEIITVVAEKDKEVFNTSFVFPEQASSELIASFFHASINSLLNQFENSK